MQSWRKWELYYSFSNKTWLTLSQWRAVHALKHCIPQLYIFYITRIGGGFLNFMPHYCFIVCADQISYPHTLLHYKLARQCNLTL
uniref:Uncharacterized protein n=1 Tax=Pararge aegeria TaxID=116150 RepID=S4P1X9_9NEOP